MENKNFALNFISADNLTIVEFSGYLAAGVTEVLVPQVEERLENGELNFLFDFAGVSMLESAAVAGILAVTEKIVDDRQGYLAFCRLNEVSQRVLEMVGIFLYAGFFETREQALSEMSES
jgi:anti-anti-sigma regulatory factor